MPIAQSSKQVRSVTGGVVDNADPKNPIINAPPDGLFAANPVPVLPSGMIFRGEWVAGSYVQFDAVSYGFRLYRMTFPSNSGNEAIAPDIGGGWEEVAIFFELRGSIAAEVARADAAYDAAGAAASAAAASDPAGTAAAIISTAYAQATDPHIAGRLWNNGGVPSFSDG